MQLPCRITCQASTILTWLLSLAHGGVAWTLYLLIDEQPGLSWLLAGLLPLLACSLGWQLWRLYGPRSVVNMLLHADGAIELQTRDDALLQGQVQAQTTVIYGLVVLLLRLENGASLALTLLPDSMARNDFRQLRLWLRWLAITQGRGQEAGKTAAAAVAASMADLR